MTVEIKKDRIHQGKLEKRIFETPDEAREYLKIDSLACIYRSATEVTVITAYGTGKFSKQAWDDKSKS